MGFSNRCCALTQTPQHAKCGRRMLTRSHWGSGTACPVLASENLGQYTFLTSSLDALESVVREGCVDWGWQNLAGGGRTAHRTARCRERWG
jgi:hypothetical protein